MNATSLQPVWQAPTGFASPLIVGNTIYAMQNGQGVPSLTNIDSFNLANGHVNWNYSGTYAFPSEPAYANGLVAFAGNPIGTTVGMLNVLNAATGTLDYQVNIPQYQNAVINILPGTAGNLPVAYVADGNYVTAVSLGATSGSVLWTATGGFGGQSIPSVIGNSVIVAGPGQYYSIDRTSGAENHFFVGQVTGGGGSTPAVDAARNQFYILTDYNSTTPTLTAYKYASNSSITQIWQRTGSGVGVQGGVAIGPDGGVYAADTSTLVELDPATGNILRQVAGSFATGNAPMISNGYLWEFDKGPGSGPNSTYAYRLSDLSLAATFTGTRGNLNSPYDSAGALTDDYFVQTYPTVYGYSGFQVYNDGAPEPASAGVCIVAGALFLIRRPRKRQRQSFLARAKFR
ncbi:MAG TPA: PQQ-binding-like beta-propeller repeat protein [Tepidisphaeraceae bacterium]|nr:PQQ-binding-like beta-propeller repeat protein [Tepidisphaeraceae bacterium]